MNKAIFLDRDGVLIHNRRDYVRNLKQMVPYKNLGKAMALLSLSPYKIIILTNQSAIGRGVISTKDVDAINACLLDMIAHAGGRIDKIYICPHAPTDNCVCRKPKPGLIFQAKDEFHLDLKNSWLVGDAFSDLKAGVDGGVGNLVLLQTGRGKKQLQHFRTDFAQIDFSIKTDINDAAKFIYQG